MANGKATREKGVMEMKGSYCLKREYLVVPSATKGPSTKWLIMTQEIAQALKVYSLSKGGEIREED